MVTLWYTEIGHPLCVHNDLIENNNNVRTLTFYL